ncbi:hypothetical protein Tco_1168622 [Tanacetum coccineum]
MLNITTFLEQMAKERRLANSQVNTYPTNYSFSFTDTPSSQVTPPPNIASMDNITMSPTQRDTLVSLLNVSPQSTASPAPSLTQTPHKEDREQFFLWISDYKLLDDLVMIKNVGTYKGLGDHDLHVWILEGVIKTCAWNDTIAYHMFQQTLIDSAVSWFKGRAKNSITGWEDLKDKFISNFQPI